MVTKIILCDKYEPQTKTISSSITNDILQGIAFKLYNGNVTKMITVLRSETKHKSNKYKITQSRICVVLGFRLMVRYLKPLSVCVCECV